MQQAFEDGYTWANDYTITRIHSLDWQVLEEDNTTTGRDARYVWSPIYIDAMILRDRDTNEGTAGYEERTWPQFDANFNVLSLTNDSGTVVNRFELDPYGALTATTGSAGTSLQWKHLHQGGELAFAGVSGLYHFRHRDYDAGLGRWLQQDPAGYVDGTSLYTAYSAVPTTSIDPAGLDDTHYTGHRTVVANWGAFTRMRDEFTLFSRRYEAGTCDYYRWAMVNEALQQLSREKEEILLDRSEKALQQLNDIRKGMVTDLKAAKKYTDILRKLPEEQLNYNHTALRALRGIDVAYSFAKTTNDIELITQSFDTVMNPNSNSFDYVTQSADVLNRLANAGLAKGGLSPVGGVLTQYAAVFKEMVAAINEIKNGMGAMENNFSGWKINNKPTYTGKMLGESWAMDRLQSDNFYVLEYKRLCKCK